MRSKEVKDLSLRPQGRLQPDFHIPGVAAALFAICLLVNVVGTMLMTQNGISSDAVIGSWTVLWILVGTFLLFSLKIASQWEKAVVLRLGKFHRLAGPGSFWVFPIVDTLANWIDHRVMVTPFSAEKTLTKDTVPVDVDAVLFWVVWDAEKAALEVADYRAAIAWAAQTALREIIGQSVLADILVGRAKMDADLQKIIDERTTPWGITVQSVEIRDVIIPPDLEDAMSRQAQAERERQSRIILGESEEQIAASFAEASKAYIHNPTALHLRAMNMLFEGLKEKGALVIVPSSAIDTMNLGGLSGMVSLAQQNLPPEKENKGILPASHRDGDPSPSPPLSRNYYNESLNYLPGTCAGRDHFPHRLPASQTGLPFGRPGHPGRGEYPAGHQRRGLPGLLAGLQPGYDYRHPRVAIHRPGSPAPKSQRQVRLLSRRGTRTLEQQGLCGVPPELQV